MTKFVTTAATQNAIINSIDAIKTATSVKMVFCQGTIMWENKDDASKCDDNYYMVGNVEAIIENVTKDLSTKGTRVVSVFNLEAFDTYQAYETTV